MGCCGDKRAIEKSVPVAGDGHVVVAYVAPEHVKVSRVPSGRVYHFSPANARQAVSRQDLSALLRTGAFRVL